MDNEIRLGAPVANEIQLERSALKIDDKARRFALAEEGYPAADRSCWSGRWRHPLMKSIQGRRGKPSRFWTATSSAALETRRRKIPDAEWAHDGYDWTAWGHSWPAGAV